MLSSLALSLVVLGTYGDTGYEGEEEASALYHLVSWSALLWRFQPITAGAGVGCCRSTGKALQGITMASDVRLLLVLSTHVQAQIVSSVWLPFSVKMLVRPLERKSCGFPG